MERILRKFSSFKEMKDEEYRYWRSVSPEERFAAGHQFSVEGYREYGHSVDGQGLKAVAVRLQHPQR